MKRAMGLRQSKQRFSQLDPMLCCGTRIDCCSLIGVGGFMNPKFTHGDRDIDVGGQGMELVLELLENLLVMIGLTGGEKP
jgi:hypothetical protein